MCNADLRISAAHQFKIVVKYLERKRIYEMKAAKAQIKSWKNFVKQTIEGVWQEFIG